MPSAAPAVPTVDLTMTLSIASGETRTLDLTTRAVIVAVVPAPRFGREAEVLAGVVAAVEAGADVVEVPVESRLLGPAVRGADIPVAAFATNNETARQASASGAALLLVPRDAVAAVLADDEQELRRAGEVVPPVVAVVTTAAAGRDAVLEEPERPVLIDVTGLSVADAVSEESLALAVGVRLVRTTDIRRTRRVVEVMAHLLAARR